METKKLKTKQFLLKLTHEEHKLLMQKAMELDISASDYIRITSINLLKNNINK
jgi:hypothetical protein